MKTIAVYCEVNSDLELTINKIAERIPCFVEISPVEDYMFVSIECRQDDASFVELMLAPFV